MSVRQHPRIELVSVSRLYMPEREYYMSAKFGMYASIFNLVAVYSTILSYYIIPDLKDVSGLSIFFFLLCLGLTVVGLIFTMATMLTKQSTYLDSSLYDNYDFGVLHSTQMYLNIITWISMLMIPFGNLLLTSTLAIMALSVFIVGEYRLIRFMENKFQDKIEVDHIRPVPMESQSV